VASCAACRFSRHAAAVLPPGDRAGAGCLSAFCL